MDQNKRTKVLAGALAVVMGFGFIRPDQKIMEPIREAENARRIAAEKLAKASDDMLLVTAAEFNLEQAQFISLPPSPTDALRVYQKWITNLAEQCKFSALKISPGRIDQRADRFLTVNVQLDGEISLEGFSRFMFLFDQADVKHRITSLDISSTGTSGSPRMEVTLTAQGMSVTGTAQHADVFPLTQLATELAADQTQLVVKSADSFPQKTPFLVQVGTEMVEVTSIDENQWTMTRAVQGTKAVQHASSEYVQLFPIRYQDNPVTFDDYQNFLASSPFVKPVVPRKRTPKIAGLKDKTIAPGESVSLKVSTTDIDADVGTVTYELEDAVDGMTLDSETGKFTWETTAETEAKKYSPQIVVRQKNNEDLKLSKSFSITLKLPNDAPTLKVASEAVVIIGQKFELKLSAKDDGDDRKLKFSFEGNVPEGLVLDGSNRKLTWIPAKTFLPRDYDVKVKVTDGGKPAKSVTKSVKLKVQDDQAIYMKLTGSVALDGQPVALFRNLISAENPKLKIGDKLEVSEISATIKEIANRYILIEDAEGIWQIDLGDTIRNRKLIKPAEKQEVADAADANSATTKDSATMEDSDATKAGQAESEAAPADPAQGDDKIKESTQPAEKTTEPDPADDQSSATDS